MRHRSIPHLLVLACLLVGVALVVPRRNRGTAARPAAASLRPASPATDVIAPASARLERVVTSRDERDHLVAEKLLARLSTTLAREQGRPNEAMLTFKDADAYRRFLARAAASGLEVLDRLDRLQSVRVRYDSLNALAADLANHTDDYGDLDANYFVYPPEVPQSEPRMGGKPVPIGNGLLETLGVTGDTSKWGAGVTIAVLDSGAAADATFGTNRLRHLDVGLGVTPMPEDGHGTAVASLAGGMDGDAVGLAPGANLLSIRVTAEDGLSDSFTLSRAIIAAADAGAQIVNVSLGSYADSNVMARAIDYATSRSVLVVASAGNDQAGQLTWPAANPSVISVGAVDATEQQVFFSNSGDQLQITAPGYGLQTAWLNNQRVLIDGTSASAPIVAGAIAAMMTQNPGTNAAQAWDILRSHASDGGAVGRDPNFGNGILNLGWAMNRNNFNRIDTAVSSQFLDPAALEMQFVVQNRSAQGVAGLVLNVNAGQADRKFSVPPLGPGATFAVHVPVDYAALQNAGRLDYRTQLVNPSGMIDAVPANNQRANTISFIKPQ
ncbi:MAG: S8 family serine peptidase [Chthoniobacteraceae bacterium]